MRALSLDDVNIAVNKTRLTIAVLKWHSGLPGANELRMKLIENYKNMVHFKGDQQLARPYNHRAWQGVVLCEFKTCWLTPFHADFVVSKYMYVYM